MFNIFTFSSLSPHCSLQALVTSTGMSTEMGKISSAVQEAKHTKTKTPLAQSLDQFSIMLTKAVVLICLSVWLVNIPRFSSPSFGTGTKGWLKGCLYYFKVSATLTRHPLSLHHCLSLSLHNIAPPIHISLHLYLPPHISLFVKSSLSPLFVIRLRLRWEWLLFRKGCLL